MRVLSIGSDRKLFESNSAVASRARAYGARFGHLDILVFSLRAHALTKTELAPGVFVYPTNSASKWRYVFDAIKIGKTLLKPDVITVQDPFESGFVGMKLSSYLKAPLHVQVHTDLGAIAFKTSSLLNRVRMLIAPRVLKHAARIRVVSKRIADYIKAQYQLKAEISVLPIFVDTMRFANATVPEQLTARFTMFEKKVLVVSRLESEKNPCLALRAFAAGAPHGSCLIIVGEGSELTLLQHLAKELKVESRVFFEWFQDPVPYYKFADLVLCTSKYEGYGLVIVEALAEGIPVLSTDVGIAREAGAIIADADFSKSLADWFAKGDREGHLKLQTYSSVEAYVTAYCDDIKSVAV